MNVSVRAFGAQGLWKIEAVYIAITCRMGK